jgi:hypothetical protein
MVNENGEYVISDDQSKSFRKNYAGIDFVYDEKLDAFIPPKPFESWVLDRETCFWGSPVPLPNDGNYYLWDEENTAWVLSPEA